LFKILLLEDDTLFAESLEDFLTEEDFLVEVVKDGEKAVELCYENSYDLYLFDINVPKVNGLRLLRELRLNGDETPTIYLTSYKDKETLKIGFVAGCDDYLKKPVDLDELLLRIKSLLKRNIKTFETIKIRNNLFYEPKNKRFLKDNNEVYIPNKVIDLFELFWEHKDSIITKEMIINKLWDYTQEYSEGSIRVYINNLKKLLGKDSIKNIKAIGYKFEL